MSSNETWAQKKTCHLVTNSYMPWSKSKICCTACTLLLFMRLSTNAWKSRVVPLSLCICVHLPHVHIWNKEPEFTKDLICEWPTRLYPSRENDIDSNNLAKTVPSYSLPLETQAWSRWPNHTVLNCEALRSDYELHILIFHRLSPLFIRGCYGGMNCQLRHMF